MFKKRKAETALLKKINKKAIKYCSVKNDLGEEIIIGKRGAINVFDDEITIVCDGTIVFRCRRKNAKVFELMSLGGAVIEGETEAEIRTVVTAYYTSP